MKYLSMIIPALVLAACKPDAPKEVSYGNDALPSAEVIAFEKANKRFRYADARIEYDGRDSALYQGTAPDGRVHREPLLDAAGKPLCARK